MRTYYTDMENRNYFLCQPGEEKPLIKQAEKESREILKELKKYMAEDLEIKVHVVHREIGLSIAGDFTVNGKHDRTYDPISLLFLDLDGFILRCILKARKDKEDASNNGSAEM